MQPLNLIESENKSTKAFIVPDELPSLLSVVYSNIPTIKKGTDSRLGWGFRLGDRADFQVMVELGPQTNTQPLANQGGDGNTNKRNALNNLANRLYAQRQHEKKMKEKKKIEEERKKTEKTEDKASPLTPNSDGAIWLQTWIKSMSKQQTKKKQMPLQPKPGIAIGEIDAKSVIPEDEDDEKMKKRWENVKRVFNEKVKTTTSKADALDNVDLS
ncbi:unnamed protein product [Acanthoscelides obtectus]|uniref:Uncharacterized protein n=1 Tax=Acanthoscelides obtectus TaxID=200917 RepID=A0A9P0JQ25_ACAOB|nr:unnamed protein product [Acanthoscelides obtectus]CAK1662025.1 hypothetical protein AOBTE_LOCUS22937 [Acanthoscelides obtectus]